MWFKRRKKTEQDHALSESLRSLQSLLSETSRHEPNLDPYHAPADDTDTDVSDDSWPAAGPALAAQSGNADRTRPDHHDAPAAEPETPGGSGNRWRDLNLTFDAEPVIPRARRDAEADDAAVPPESTLDTDPTSGTTTGEPASEDAEIEPAAPADPAYGLDEESSEDADVPVADDEAHEAAPPVDSDPAQEPARSQPDSGAAEAAVGDDSSIITDQNRHDDDYDFPSRAAEEFLVLDLEGPQLSPPAGPEGGAPSAGGPMEHQSAESISDIEVQPPEPGDDADLDDIATDTVALESPADEPEPAGEPATAGDDEQAEDQLHLELESSAVSEADIPVLTNAVYVPEPPQEQETAPGPPESPHEEPIARCIDNFRVRLQLTGLGTLSTAQEKELHDSLVEFLDEIEHD